TVVIATRSQSDVPAPGTSGISCRCQDESAGARLITLQMQSRQDGLRKRKNRPTMQNLSGSDSSQIARISWYFQETPPPIVRTITIDRLKRNGIFYRYFPCELF